jgi:hypothetical protein
VDTGPATVEVGAGESVPLGSGATIGEGADLGADVGGKMTKDAAPHGMPSATAVTSARTSWPMHPALSHRSNMALIALLIAGPRCAVLLILGQSEAVSQTDLPHYISSLQVVNSVPWGFTVKSGQTLVAPPKTGCDVRPSPTSMMISRTLTRLPPAYRSASRRPYGTTYSTVGTPADEGSAYESVVMDASAAYSR